MGVMSSNYLLRKKFNCEAIINCVRPYERGVFIKIA